MTYHTYTKIGKNCQEFVRTLNSELPPDRLPADLTIAIIGCGSPTLIDSYIKETKCQYPVYAEPSKRLHGLLGMKSSLSLGSRSPGYIRHSLMAGAAKSIVQGVKRIPSGDALSAGDMRLNGGEFLFELRELHPVAEKQTEQTESASVRLMWSHLMSNSRDHTEVSELRRILRITGVDVVTRRRSTRDWTPKGITRSLSNRRRSAFITTKSTT